MSASSASTKSIVAFLMTAYALAVGLSLVIGLSGGHTSPMSRLGYLSMLIPTVSIFILQLTLKESLAVEWSRFSWRYLPLALLLMPLVMHLTMLSTTVILEGGLQWQPWLTPQADGLYHTPEKREWGTLTRSALITRILTNAFVGLLVVSALALLEEIGWRAWLLPRLAERMTARKAIGLMAFLWALWHVPYALSGIEHIEGLTSWQLALLMPVGILGGGLLIGWLWVRTQSIWLVSLAHGSLNNWGQLAFKYLNDVERVIPIQLLGIGNLALLFTGIVFWLSLPAEHKSSLPERDPTIRTHGP